MEKDLLGGSLGSVGSYDVKFEDGKLVMSLAIDAIDIAIVGLKKAKELIPGHFDDMAIDAAIPMLEALKSK